MKINDIVLTAIKKVYNCTDNEALRYAGNDSNMSNVAMHTYNLTRQELITSMTKTPITYKYLLQRFEKEGCYGFYITTCTARNYTYRYTLDYESINDDNYSEALFCNILCNNEIIMGVQYIEDLESFCRLCEQSLVKQ